MSTDAHDEGADPGALSHPDLSNSVDAILRRRFEAIKAGDAGVLPVLVGLVAIVIFFTSKNSNFLTAPNFTNLIGQMAAVTTIAIGVVFVLLLGEIDLSIGYVSGVAGVVVAKLQLPDSSWEIKGVAAIVDRGDRRQRDRPAAGLDRREDRCPELRRHARGPAVLAGRHPPVDRRRRRDHDPGLDDQQRRQLLLQRHRRDHRRDRRGGALRRRDGRRRRQPPTPRDHERQPRGRRREGRVRRRRRDRLGRLGEQRARLPDLGRARHRAAHPLDVGRRADDVRAPRLRRRRQRRGSPPGRASTSSGSGSTCS